MRKKFFILPLLVLLLSALPAWAEIGPFDIGLSFGTSSHYFEKTWDESKLSFQYGATFGLSDVYELDVTAVSELIPDFFGDTVMHVMLQRSFLGARNTGTAVAGSGYNILFGFGMGFSDYHESGEWYPTHLLFSLTPAVVGSPALGKRERLFTLTLAVNIYDTSISLYFDLMTFDFYLFGNYRQHPRPVVRITETPET